MQHLTKLFKLMELTKNQLMTGYAPSGLGKHELDNLASHHYLVTFIAWQLARSAKKAGSKINIERVMEFAMIHDLGELFGGDISMHYAKINKSARKKAKEFELENQKFLARFFGKDRKYIQQLMQEILDAKSDEAITAKLADYLESAHYLVSIGRIDKKILGINSEKLRKTVGRIKDNIAQEEFTKFIASWEKAVLDDDVLDIIYGNKNER